MENARIIIVLLLLLVGVEGIAQSDVLKYSMKTRWAENLDPENVWPEYPRPQMKRDTEWDNLNGYWEYAIQSKTKKAPKKYTGKILVPFAVESELSGVKKLVGEDNYLWYRKSFTAPKLANGERLVLHFGAVDWESKVYLNGKELGSHKGGFDSFSFDVTDHLNAGSQELVVRVWDPSDKGTQPRGKQVSNPFGIWYTPVTGIWQTVWLEKVPDTRIVQLKLTPNIDTREIGIEVFTNTSEKGLRVKVEAFDSEQLIRTEEFDYPSNSEVFNKSLSIPSPKLWSPDNPFLYDLKLSLINEDGKIIDEVESYFGMRKISIGKDAKGYTRIMLNNQPLFQFGLLDQGWWPDGLYTAPSEEAMLYDVEMTRKMGFNMLRKHVKVEPARFYYHCDRIGMLVWQDMPNGNYLNDIRIQAWEEDADRPKESAVQFEAELKEMMDEFHSFPSILVWVPFNEGWGQYETERVTEWTKKYDPSRIIDSPSGWADRGIGDVIDVHLYPGPGMEPVEDHRAAVLGEFGGLGYPVKDHLWWNKKNWGYLTYQDESTFKSEFKKLILGLKGLIGEGLSAAIYTQTTDVEGEVNGLITYDREVVKIKPSELKEMITPLYNSYWRPIYLLKDSEISSNTWKYASESADDSWKTVDFDDFSWKKINTPISSYANPFLDKSSAWEGNEMLLRKTFQATEIPSKLFLKHYLPKAHIKIFLNGKLIQEITDQGGRKRHYTVIDISEFTGLLNIGNNMIAVEADKIEEKASFDIGLFTTEEYVGANKKNEVTPGAEQTDSKPGTTKGKP